MELNEKLHQLRKKNGFTQAELAEKLNVSRQSVSNWELGTITPSVGRLKALSQLYNVPWESLLSNEILECPVEKSPKEEIVLENCNDDAEKKISEKSQSNDKRRTRVIVFLLIAILVITGVIFAVYSSGKEDEPVRLDQMTDGEIAVSSGNSFDLQF